jgi:hypothetical protein
MQASERRNGRWPLGVVLAVGTVLRWPALRSPPWLDDYTHAAMVEGTFPAHRGPLDLYDFVGDADRAQLFQRGVLPWWSSPELKIRFFRPLSSAILWADHKLFDHAPFPQHLHSLAWWVGVVLAAHALFEALLSRRVALAATTIFALAPCHTVPIAWLANREELLSVFFGILGVRALLAKEASLRSVLIATLTFSLSLLSGEYALCFGGYALASAWLHEGSWRSRAARVLSFAAPAAVYLWLRERLGYGTAGSSFYRDPLREPWFFVAQVPRRVAALLLDVWYTLDSDGWTVTSSPWIVALVLVPGMGLLAAALKRSIEGAAPHARRVRFFFLTGSLLALLPVLPVAPSPRVAMAAVLGAAPLVALILEEAWFPAQQDGRTSQVGQIAATFLAFAHLVHGPASSWLEARAFRTSAESFRSHGAWLREHVGDPARARVFMPRANWQTVLFQQFAIAPRGVPPAEWRTLALAPHVLVLRIDTHTVDVVVAKQSSFFPTGPNDLFRNTPLNEGDEVDVPGIHVTVLSVGGDRPVRIRFVFAEDPDDPSITWVAETQGGFTLAPLPAPGYGMPVH